MGLYANQLLYPQSVDVSRVKGIRAKHKPYPDNANLHLDDMVLGDDSHIILDSGLHWVDGDITALDNTAIERLSEKNVTFECEKLIIHSELYEKYSYRANFEINTD